MTRAVREGGSGTICGMANIRPDLLRPAAAVAGLSFPSRPVYPNKPRGFA